MIPEEVMTGHKKSRPFVFIVVACILSLIFVSGPISVADTHDPVDRPESYARLYENSEAESVSQTLNIPQATCGAGGPCLFYLNNSWSDGNADIEFNFGRGTDTPLAGDWDGDGKGTIGVRRGDQYFLRNENSPGPHHHWISYGKANDKTYVGDWDGNGTDTLGVRRGNAYYLRNQNSSGTHHTLIRYGRSGDETFVGDWDGDGTDTLAVRRGNECMYETTSCQVPPRRSSAMAGRQIIR